MSFRVVIGVDVAGVDCETVEASVVDSVAKVDTVWVVFGVVVAEVAVDGDAVVPVVATGVLPVVCDSVLTVVGTVVRSVTYSNILHTTS